MIDWFSQRDSVHAHGKNISKSSFAEQDLELQASFFPNSSDFGSRPMYAPKMRLPDVFVVVFIWTYITKLTFAGELYFRY